MGMELLHTVGVLSVSRRGFVGVCTRRCVADAVLTGLLAADLRGRGHAG